MRPAEFPAIAYQPGVTQRPDKPWLEAVKERLDHAALVEKGFALLRAGYFWEAHELLEKAWLARQPNSPERAMLQAVIQIANALLKHRMGRPNAARRLFAESAQILSGLGLAKPVFGLDPGVLAEQARCSSHDLSDLSALQALET